MIYFTEVFLVSFFSGPSKKTWRWEELENLPPDDFVNLISSIPTDNESEVSSVTDDDVCDGKDIFDIMAMDVDIFDVEEQQDTAAAVVITNDEWESEDEVPLAQLQLQLRNTTIQWTKQTTFCTQVDPFIENSGPVIPQNLETPTDIFLHLFTLDLIEKIVFETNLYAVQKQGGNCSSFVPTTSTEIKVFLGLNLLMGLKPIPSYRDYWSSRIELRDDYISTAMSRDRFGWLLSNLHLNNNATEPKKQDDNYDKLYKIRPLLDALSNSYQNSFMPSEHQSIDESMIRFKGRSSIRQYMPMKPIKRGYKVWVRSDETGFMSQFQIYTGKVSNLIEKSLGARVVKDLSRELVGKKHKLYFDNFFNSVELQNSLLLEGIYACGTARKNRKNMPNDLRDDKHLKRGESDYRVSTDGIVALKWMDRKGVLFISNFHNPAYLETASRRKKDGSKEDVVCPSLVIDYNRHMGYVDKFDMLKSLYEIDRKSRKWWHRIFWYFVDATVINSYIIFKSRMPNTMTLKQFRLSVVSGLVGANPEQAKRGRKNIEKPPNKFKTFVPQEVKYDKNAHMPIHTPSLRCAQCSSRKEPHRTVWKCSTCNVGLCLKDVRNCFYDFHKP